MDGILVAYECIDFRLKDGESVVRCKLDMEKTYDLVNWVFLDYILGRMGFSVRRRGWMRKCY